MSTSGLLSTAVVSGVRPEADLLILRGERDGANDRDRQAGQAHQQSPYGRSRTSLTFCSISSREKGLARKSVVTSLSAEPG